MTYSQWVTAAGSSMPGYGAYTDDAMALWVWSEPLVMLLNKQRRAIHDFLAGTVVLHIEPPGPPSN